MPDRPSYHPPLSERQRPLAEVRWELVRNILESKGLIHNFPPKLSQLDPSLEKAIFEAIKSRLKPGEFAHELFERIVENKIDLLNNQRNLAKIIEYVTQFEWVEDGRYPGRERKLDEILRSFEGRPDKKHLDALPTAQNIRKGVEDALTPTEVPKHEAENWPPLRLVGNQ